MFLNVCMPSHYSRHQPTHLGKAIILIGFAMIAYMLFRLTISIYKNYQIDRHIQNFERKNQQLAMENSQKIEDFNYYTSASYIEKVAKQSLGLINPGEEVIIIPEEDVKLILENEEKAKRQAEEQKRISNPGKWWRFFFVENPYR